MKFQEIGDEFRADLADCFTVEPEPEPETTCPGADVITAVSNENTASFAVPVDNPGMCNFIGVFNSATINRQGESIFLETVFNNGTPSVVSLNDDQAEACLAQIGCTEFFSEPESPPSMSLTLPSVQTLESLELAADPVAEEGSTTVIIEEEGPTNPSQCLCIN